MNASHPEASPTPGTSARATLRATPWLRVLLAFIGAFASGIATAWIIQWSGTWLDGADWEHRVLAFAQATVSPVLDPFFYALPFIGTNYTLLPFVVLACAWLWYRRHYTTALHLGVIQLGSLLLNVTLKTLLARPRPDMYDPRGQHGLAAYPSGHSIAITSVGFTIAYLLHRHGNGTWAYWVVGFLFIANNWSRVYLGVHWPTDVVGGVLVGAIWLLGGIRAFGGLEAASRARSLLPDDVSVTDERGR